MRFSRLNRELEVGCSSSFQSNPTARYRVITEAVFIIRFSFSIDAHRMAFNHIDVDIIDDGILMRDSGFL
jgi:hypothetical protein